ncbi:MAG: 2-polyprenylphenol 6-hydroxylase [Alphaproteobacteria bacterium]|nr:2-polyprenylphenol 6-hydroxylase [Alphaproteobacteria bacterium]
MLRALRNLARLARIGWTLARHDALVLAAMAGVPPGLIRLGRRLARSDAAGRPGQRLAAAFESLGPSFIKLGQILSTRSDLIGDEVAGDLALLRDSLPPFPAAQARAIVAEELGAPVEALYQRFADEPVAAASIAQVHFAVTIEGEEVAVKVLRPGVVEAFARDLDLFYWLGEQIERLKPSLRRLRPQEVADTLAQTVQMEMDLRFEAAAASELAENFRGDPGFRVPEVDWRRTARRVLTIQRIQGIAIDRREEIIAAGHDVNLILTRAAESFFQQVFRDGFFHADLHPGNLFVAEDGAVVVIDFGIMGRLDRKTRDYLAEMLVGFLTRDYRRVAEVHFRAGYVPETKSVDAFTQACRSIGEPILEKPLNQISIARLLGQLFKITEQFDMEVQPQLLLLQKTMLVAEGVGRKLNPDVNLWEMARPMIEDWMIAKHAPDQRIRDFVADAKENLERIPRLLAETEKATQAILEGGIKLSPETIRTLRGEDSNRVPWTLVIAVVALAAAVVALAR